MKKFELLEIEHLNNLFKSKGIDFVKEIDSIKKMITPVMVKDFIEKDTNNLTDYDQCRDMIAVLYFKNNTEKITYKNSILPTSLLLTLYKGLKHKKVFNITEDLFFKLMNTEAKSINPALIKMPFETIVFNLPDTSVEVNNGVVLKFKEIVVTYNKTDNMLISQSFSEGIKDGMVMLEQSGIVFNLNNSTAESMFEESIEILKDARVRLKSNNPLEDDIQVYRFYFNFVVNAILYINSIDEFKVTQAKYYIPKKKNNKANRLKEKTKVDLKNKDLSKFSRIIIGSNRALSDEESKQLKQMKSIISCPKWLVRGHWRNQRFGDNNTSVKVIWIEPYTKGKGLIHELSQKEYLVK